jgi:ZIP family zinc transporter
MSQILQIISVTWLAGLTAMLGGVIARFDSTKDSVLKNEILHGITALGGGILLAAVAFALVPEGIDTLNAPTLAISLLSGGIAFCALDWWLGQQKSSKAQFVAMLADYIPEAISLGAVFATDPKLGYFLAAFIAAQNLPEGFNAYRELSDMRHRLLALFGASLLGPLAAAAGYLFLEDFPAVTATLMTFAGGGILYLVFQDIAPQAKLQRHWIPALGAVIGFLFGVMGKYWMH